MTLVELTAEQKLLADALRRYLAGQLPQAALDRARREQRGYEPGLWRGLAELGVPGLLVPQAHGGSGLGLLEAVLAAQALGGAAAPVPFIGTAVAALAIARNTDDALQRQWLPRIAEGSERFALVRADTVHLEAGRLHGSAAPVGDVDGATALLVVLADGRAALAPADAAHIERRASVDGLRGVAHVAFDGVPAQLLAWGGDAHLAAVQLLDAARLLLAADSAGAAQAMLDAAVAYARERQQFGRPIGSFQGVKYLCADMAVQLEPCHALLWQAARAQDGSDHAQARLAALQAKAHVDDVAREVSRMAVEVHGGVGFTELIGLHHRFRRITSNRQRLGNPEWCRREAAQVQGWPECA